MFLETNWCWQVCLSFFFKSWSSQIFFKVSQTSLFISAWTWSSSFFCRNLIPRSLRRSTRTGVLRRGVGPTAAVLWEAKTAPSPYGWGGHTQTYRSVGPRHYHCMIALSTHFITRLFHQDIKTSGLICIHYFMNNNQWAFYPDMVMWVNLKWSVAYLVLGLKNEKVN